MTCIRTIIKFLVISVLFQTSNSYRILCLLPSPAPSHHIVFRAFVNGLLHKGHEIVVATPYPVKDTHQNLTQIDWSNAHGVWQNTMNKALTSSSRSFQMAKQYFEAMKQIIDIELSHPYIQNLLSNTNNEYFDAVIVENHYYSMYEFAKILNAPLLVICSSDANAMEHTAIGNVVHAIAAPVRIGNSYGPLSFIERIKVVYRDLLFKPFYYFLERSVRSTVEKHFGPHSKSYDELTQEIDMLFINVNPVFGYIRPITPKTITLGFMHVQEPKPLPGHLQEYLDTSTNGVVYCSFGTQVQSQMLDNSMMDALLHSFSKLKYNVIFKFSGKELGKLPENVKIMEWLPQADLLAHRNIKLFITQGGQHSIEEAIYRGVPLLVIPFFGDQFVNGKRIEARQFGKWLNRNNIDSEILSTTIEDIVSNLIYKENIMMFSQIVKDQPMHPVQKAVWWTEYAIRNKESKDVLKYHGVDIPAYQYFYLDVMAAYFCIAILIYYGFKLGVYALMRIFSKLKLLVFKKKVD